MGGLVQSGVWLRDPSPRSLPAGRSVIYFLTFGEEVRKIFLTGAEGGGRFPHQISPLVAAEGGHFLTSLSPPKAAGDLSSERAKRARLGLHFLTAAEGGGRFPHFLTPPKAGARFTTNFISCQNKINNTAWGPCVGHFYGSVGIIFIISNTNPCVNIRFSLD